MTGTGELCEVIVRACSAALPELSDGPARDTVRRVRDRLGERTPRVAVGGRLKAGKSTLVNALLGQRLAPTDATECTRTVAWFRYHHQNSVRVTPRRGEPYALPPGPGGTIPADLGRSVEDVAQVTVEVSNEVLKLHHTIVDTPGLDSLTSGGALDDDSMTALGECDALVFVMPHPGQREQEALEAFRAAMRGSGLAMTNVVGVLSRIDQLGEGVGDPWPQAHRVAGRYALRLRSQVADVIPVVGLLAEAALGDAFTESDARLLRDLALGTDPAERERSLYTGDTFLAASGLPIDEVARVRLLGLLGRYGIGESLALIDRGAQGAARLMTEYRALSGIDPLLGFIRTRFVENADTLRAHAALAELDQVAWSGTGLAERQALAVLLSELAPVRASPALRRGELARILAELDSRQLRLPKWAEQDLADLVKGGGAAECAGLPADAATDQIAASADDRIRRWRRLEGDYRPAVARVAADVRESFEALYYSLTR